ncbi:unnamed protein product [Anisakis simplex]|uniref:Arginine/serine-rich coiled-coil protein 2 n=1 Tax=Anisakis simplex TaxID=6269 RepID=A0A0M3KBH0_ANISI|nr:unnamed protein product [Anisakis simplex]
MPVPQMNGSSRRGSGLGSGLMMAPAASGRMADMGRPQSMSSMAGDRRDVSPSRRTLDYNNRQHSHRGGGSAMDRPLRQQLSSDRGDRLGDADRIPPPEDDRRRMSASSASKNLDERRYRSDAASSSFDTRDRDTRRYPDEERRDDRYREPSPRSSMSRREDIDDRQVFFVYSDRDYEDRMDRRRNTSAERADRHDRGARSSTAVRSSSRSGELRRSRSIRESDQRRFEERVHAVPPSTTLPASTMHTNRLKKSRLARQHRSMSSSEDEMPSTSDGHSGEELVPRADVGISSEKDILRYIYGSTKLRNGRKAFSVNDLPTSKEQELLKQRAICIRQLNERSTEFFLIGEFN